MLRFRLFQVDIRLSFLFFAVVTVYLILDRSGFGYCGVFAAVVHETGHLIACCLSNAKPSSVTLSFEGMRLASSERYLSSGKELFVLLAGSGMNLLLGSFFFLSGTEIFLKLALSQFLIGGFNLLPVGALDGSLALECFLSFFFSLQTVYKINLILSLIVVIPLILFGFFLFWSVGNITLLITSLFLFLLLLKQQKKCRLICNRGRNKVQ